MRVVTAPRDRSAGKVPGALATGTGAIVIGVVNFGIQQMVIVALVSFGVLVLILRIVPPLGKSRLERRAKRSEDLLVAWATRDGRAGKLHISRADVVFDGKKVTDDLVLRKDDVAEAELSPVSPLVRGTRVRFTRPGLGEVKFTVTAPLEDVRRAL